MGTASISKVRQEKVSYVGKSKPGYKKNRYQAVDQEMSSFMVSDFGEEGW